VRLQQLQPHASKSDNVNAALVTATAGLQAQPEQNQVQHDVSTLPGGQLTGLRSVSLMSCSIHLQGVSRMQQLELLQM
jgi:hypothetical protein